MPEMIAIPVIPNPKFLGEVGTLRPNNKLDLKSTTKGHKGRLRNVPVNAIPQGFVAIVRWDSLTPENQVKLGGTFPDGTWVWIVPRKQEKQNA